MPEVWDNKHDKFVTPAAPKRRVAQYATRRRQSRYDERFDSFVSRGKKEWGIEYHPVEGGSIISFPTPNPLPPDHSYDAENKQSMEQRISAGYQSLMFYPEEFKRDLPSTVLTVDEVRSGAYNFHIRTTPIKIVQFTVFDQPIIIEERVTVVTRQQMIEQIGQIALALSDWEEVEAMVRGEEVLRIDLPAPIVDNRCKLHINCRGHFSEDSYRDNLR